MLLNAVIVEPFSSSVTDTSSDVADALVTVPHCPFRDPFLMFVSAILVPGRIDGRDAKPRSAATPRVARSRHRIARDSFAANTKPTAAPEASLELEWVYGLNAQRRQNVWYSSDGAIVLEDDGDAGVYNLSLIHI